MSGLDELAANGLIEAVESDPPTAQQWIKDAKRHLQAANAIEAIDPSGTYVLAYDAARKSVAAVLLTTGYRIRGRPGAHQRSPCSQEPSPTRRACRRSNKSTGSVATTNSSEYGSRTFGAAEVREAIESAGAIVEACSGRL
jgi:hypothetical protein